ncbi:tyrosine-type recombinase/integrase [Candidatus Peregrinibacteria bacterium]|nr:tyrosine-type recombinase/integrase [Candidatus Peregrinibacteria bacterium]
MKKIPVVFTRVEVARLLNRVTNLKHQLAMALSYGAGLRLSEITLLKAEDIDFENSLIRVAGREAMIPKNLKVSLWRYIKDKKTGQEIFKVSERNIQIAFNKAFKNAGITKEMNFFSLRHSFAVHLIENGMDTHHLKKLLGLNSRRAIQAYARIADTQTQKIRSPLEDCAFLPADFTASAKTLRL